MNLYVRSPCPSGYRFRRKSPLPGDVRSSGHGVLSPCRQAAGPGCTRCNFPLAEGSRPSSIFPPGPRFYIRPARCIGGHSRPSRQPQPILSGSTLQSDYRRGHPDGPAGLGALGNPSPSLLQDRPVSGTRAFYGPLGFFPPSIPTPGLEGGVGFFYRLLALHALLGHDH